MAAVALKYIWLSGSHIVVGRGVVAFVVVFVIVVAIVIVFVAFVVEEAGGVVAGFVIVEGVVLHVFVDGFFVVGVSGVV